MQFEYGASNGFVERPGHSPVSGRALYRSRARSKSTTRNSGTGCPLFANNTCHRSSNVPNLLYFLKSTLCVPFCKGRLS
jgi:hypothetical protein